MRKWNYFYEVASGFKDLKVYFKSFGYALKSSTEVGREVLQVALGTLRAVIYSTYTPGHYDLNLYQEETLYEGDRMLNDEELREAVVQFLRSRKIPDGWEISETVRLDRLQREFLGEPLSMDLSMGRWEVKRKLKELLEPIGLLDVAPEYDIVTVKRISDGLRFGAWDIEGELINVEGDLLDLGQFKSYLQRDYRFKSNFRTDFDYRNV
jgi:hypothetical protein